MSVSDLCKQLGISRQYYYKLKREGKLDRLKLKEQSFDDYIQWSKQGLSTKPWSKIYREHQIKLIKSFFSFYKELSPENVSEWLKQISVERFSSRKDRHAAVSAYAKYLLQTGKISQTDYHTIRSLYPKRPSNYQPKQRIIYDEDLERILKASSINHRKYDRVLNKTLIIFLSNTGLRATECCSLNLKDVRFSSNIQESFIKVIGKGNKKRLVPFPLIAQGAVKTYLKYRPCIGDKLFYTWNPKCGYSELTKDCLARRFKRISELSKVSFSAHSLRHYCISKWANNPKIPVPIVQKWAGHNSITTTQIYIHSRDEEALQAAINIS